MRTQLLIQTENNTKPNSIGTLQPVLVGHTNRLLKGICVDILHFWVERTGC